MTPGSTETAPVSGRDLQHSDPAKRQGLRPAPGCTVRTSGWLVASAVLAMKPNDLGVSYFPPTFAQRAPPGLVLKSIVSARQAIPRTGDNFYAPQISK